MIECLNGCGPMSQTLYEGVEIDICEICAGVWLDTGELTTIVDTQERSWPEAVVKKVLATMGAPGISKEELGRDLNCPQCHTNLPPNNYQGNSGIIVNSCENGHGIWLDAGELAKIQIYMEKWEGIFRDESAQEGSPSPSSRTASDLLRRFLEKLTRNS